MGKSQQQSSRTKKPSSPPADTSLASSAVGAAATRASLHTQIWMRSKRSRQVPKPIGVPKPVGRPSREASISHAFRQVQAALGPKERLLVKEWVMEIQNLYSNPKEDPPPHANTIHKVIQPLLNDLPLAHRPHSLRPRKTPR